MICWIDLPSYAVDITKLKDKNMPLQSCSYSYLTTSTGILIYPVKLNLKIYRFQSHHCILLMLALGKLSIHYHKSSLVSDYQFHFFPDFLMPPPPMKRKSTKEKKTSFDYKYVSTIPINKS